MTYHILTRHPELVSGSYSPTVKIKMLKQVQHDGVGTGRMLS
jgi:hypothetical protein